jgi:CHAT domain-containing protein
LWWYPTGPFAFLPIHAAGIYNLEDGEIVADYVVSSYTPTLNALLMPLPPPTSNFKMMTVIQPHTPGHPPLPSTYEELVRIENRAPTGCLIKLGIPEMPSSVENVLLHLSNVSILHLACHGVQDPKNPLKSALILDGGQRLKISQIMEKPMPNALLAFLSACQTAMGDQDLPDEAIHIAASLLFAGFRGMVATMW